MTPSIDHYDFQFYIAEAPGLHRELRGTFRPLDDAEYAIFDEQLFTDTQVEDHARRVARLIQDRITGIDMEAGEGEWMACPDVIATGQVQPALYAKLLALVKSERANDPDPLDIAKPITAQQFVEENHRNLRRGFNMMLEHPAVAAVSCEECKLFWFEPAKGTFVERPKGTRAPRPVDKDGQPVLPCGSCPKGSPDKEHETRLNPRNRRVVELFYRYRACGWEGIPREWRGDQLLTANLSVVASVYRKHERNSLAQAIAVELLPFLMPKKTSGMGAAV